MPPRILIFRTGQLGDTLAALPALWAVREHFREARITLLSDLIQQQGMIPMREVLVKTGLIDEFVFHVKHSPHANKLPLAWRTAKLLVRLRAGRYDALVYLAPTLRGPELRRRDLRFFRLAGIKRVYGTAGWIDLPEKQPGRPLPSVEREADQLLHRLRVSGIAAPASGEGRMDLNLDAADHAEADDWLRSIGKECETDARRPWIGIGPGGKVPVNHWPEQRFDRVVRALIERFDVQPVVFGGTEDAEIGRRLIAGWGRGYNAAGELSIRGSAAALERCAMYFGHDTGTMHLAAAANVPCVAVFSSRNVPGLWSPYGEGHRIFRTSIECEGCRLVQCIERQKQCIMRVMPEQVIPACCEVLKQRCAGAEKASI